MKATVDARELAEALKKVSSITTKGKTVLPILDGVKFDFFNGKCKLTTNNLEQTIETSINAQGDDMCFVYSLVAELVKASKFFDMNVEFDLDGDKLSIASSDKGIKQRIADIEEFPAMSEVENFESYDASAEDLIKRYKKVKYAISTTGMQMVHTGCIFKGDRMYCVDGFRLARNNDESLFLNSTISVPSLAMDNISIFKGCIKMKVSNKYVEFSDGNTLLRSRLLEGEPVDDIKVIPVDHSESLTFKVKDFKSSLSYLKTFLESKCLNPVRFRGGKVSLGTTSSIVESKFNVNKNGDITVGFNLSFMEQALGQFDGEYATLHLGATNQPMLITNDSADCAIVLPVRLKSEDI